MPRLLSQEEIDALLTQVSAEESEEASPRQSRSKSGKKAQLYDFKHPDRLSKENIRSLHLIHDRYARTFSSSLSAYLRTMCEVNMVSIDQLTYFEFLMSLPEPTCFNVIAMSPLEGSAALEMNPSIVFPIVDKLLGGPGESLAEIREITDIEYRILEGVIERSLIDLQQAWEQAIDVKIEVVGRETSPQLIQIAAPNEPVVLVTFEVKISDLSGMMNLCIPSRMLEPVSNRFTQDWYSIATKNCPADTASRIEHLLFRVPLPISVYLGGTSLTVRDLMELDVNDIVVLPSRTNTPLQVRLSGIPKFEASAGEHQGKRAVKILSRIEKLKAPQPEQVASDNQPTQAQETSPEAHGTRS